MSAPTAASSSPAYADAAVLVVAAGPSGGAMMEAIIADRLRVEDGCYFVGDVLLIAPKGSRASGALAPLGGPDECRELKHVLLCGGDLSLC